MPPMFPLPIRSRLRVPLLASQHKPSTHSILPATTVHPVKDVSPIGSCALPLGEPTPTSKLPFWMSVANAGENHSNAQTAQMADNSRFTCIPLTAAALAELASDSLVLRTHVGDAQ